MSVPQLQKKLQLHMKPVTTGPHETDHQNTGPQPGRSTTTTGPHRNHVGHRTCEPRPTAASVGASRTIRSRGPDWPNFGHPRGSGPSKRIPMALVRDQSDCLHGASGCPRFLKKESVFPNEKLKFRPSWSEIAVSCRNRRIQILYIVCTRSFYLDLLSLQNFSPKSHEQHVYTHDMLSTTEDIK